MNTYAGYPNAAGMAWINLVKGEWTSNVTFEVEETNIYQNSFFFGNFQITISNDAGEKIYSSTEIIEKSSKCDNYDNGNNLVRGGDFDDEFLDSMFIVPAKGIIILNRESQIGFV